MCFGGGNDSRPVQGPSLYRGPVNTSTPDTSSESSPSSSTNVTTENTVKPTTSKDTGLSIQ